MNISFKLNGQEYNNPDSQTHINIQKQFKEKLKSTLNPILDQMNDEVGGIYINYDDDGKLIELTWGGYSVDTNAKLMLLLKDVPL